ncbi:MAG: hypothetical protein U0230_06225 [Polyangiales bacterium]
MKTTKRLVCEVLEIDLGDDRLHVVGQARRATSVEVDAVADAAETAAVELEALSDLGRVAEVTAEPVDALDVDRPHGAVRDGLQQSLEPGAVPLRAARRRVGEDEILGEGQAIALHRRAQARDLVLDAAGVLQIAREAGVDGDGHGSFR